MTASSGKLSGENETDVPAARNEQSTSADSRMLHSITLQNLLSFPIDNDRLELRNLNVLIGPNGSGKSNLLAAIDLLRATTGDLRRIFSRGGGVGEWIWKGRPNEAALIGAAVWPEGWTHQLIHLFGFRAENQYLRVTDELITFASSDNDKESDSLYAFNNGHPFIMSGRSVPAPAVKTVKIDLDRFDLDRSILAQRSDPESYPDISNLIDAYRSIRIYREWSMGRKSIFREPQKADLRTDRLEEDFSNLGLYLNKLRRIPKAKQSLLQELRNLYEGLSDFDVSIEGGTVQVFFTEGDYTIPASRLSDGSLRYLCLLAILCDPNPPPLVGIEEPELGLHPDLLPKLADLLVEASARCQLIVTTHSDILVDALSEQPESIVVCEKHEGKTSMQRLDAKELAPWLEKYRLGQLWTSGELGGTRW